MENQVKELISAVLIAFVVAMVLSFLKTTFLDADGTQEIKLPVLENKEYSTQKTEENVSKSFSTTKSSDEIELNIFPMKKLSGMSREEILSLRKDAVDKSIFASKKYSPNLDVYQVESGLPWIGAYEVSCNGTKNNNNIGNGASRESVGILNPAMMFYLNISSAYFSMRNYCSEIDYLIPHKLTYSPSERTIRAYINYKDYYAKNKMYFNNFLTDTNARDLGYNYSYMNKKQNIRFKHETNLSNSIVNTRGYYHKGYACGLPSGCNNNSPYVPEYEFYLTNTPASFNIKLWKNRPMHESQRADLNYQMIFE